LEGLGDSKKYDLEAAGFEPLSSQFWNQS